MADKDQQDDRTGEQSGHWIGFRRWVARVSHSQVIDFLIDGRCRTSNNIIMTTETLATDVMSRMQEAADKAAQGIRDIEEMRRAGRRMDQIRERIRMRIGFVDIAVPSIRELRDS